MFGQLFIRSASIKFIPVIAISLLCSKINAQENAVRFQIIRNEESIGTLEIQKKENSKMVEYQLKSTIEATFIKKFRISARESYRFKDGKLIYSHVERSINNKLHDPKELVLKNEKYRLSDGKDSKTISDKEIKANLAMLYLKEPKGISEVYCDNQQAMVEINSIKENIYRLDFPNGGSNTFHYKDGKCVMIEVKAKFFKVQLLLISS